jgi:hypothetical protein
MIISDRRATNAVAVAYTTYSLLLVVKQKVVLQHKETPLPALHRTTLLGQKASSCWIFNRIHSDIRVQCLGQGLGRFEARLQELDFAVDKHTHTHRYTMSMVGMQHSTTSALV